MILLTHLLDQIVDPHMSLGGHKQHGSDGVEEDALHLALALAEGHLGAPLRQLVDHDRPVGALGHHGGEVVTSGVPCHLEKESIK